MVSQAKTPISNCFYHLLWSYFVTVSEFSCLAKSFSVWSLNYALDLLMYSCRFCS